MHCKHSQVNTTHVQSPLQVKSERDIYETIDEYERRDKYTGSCDKVTFNNCVEEDKFHQMRKSGDYDFTECSAYATVSLAHDDQTSSLTSSRNLQ